MLVRARQTTLTSLSLFALLGSACADSPAPADSGETETGTGDGDGDDTQSGDGDGDDPTGEPECQHTFDCPTDYVCELGSCVPADPDPDPCPSGDCDPEEGCQGDLDCDAGYCDLGAECVPVDVLPDCGDAGPSLTALASPPGLADLGALALALAVGDVDGDGDDDLLVAHADGLTVVVDDQLITSALGPWQPTAITSVARDDGALDLAVWTTGLAVFDGDGMGGFAGQADIAGDFDGLDGLTRLDLDGDGDDELLAYNGFAMVIWWNEAGVLTSQPGPTKGPHGLAVGDFGEDGRDELVSGDSPLGLDVYAYAGGGAGWTVDPLNGMVSGSFDGLVTARLPGDGGLLGIAAVDSRTPGDLALLEVYRAKNVGWPSAAESLVQLPARYSRLAAGDFDGDGFDTILAYADDDGGAPRLLELTEALAQYCHADPGLPATEQVAIGDLDGDGDDELALIDADGVVRLFAAP